MAPKAAWVCSALALLLFQAATSANAEEFLVRDQEEYREAVKRLTPGDTIKLANGQWRDFEIVFTGNGLPGQPITLTAETKGRVFITGVSNLRLGGEHLVVSGLVFKDGHTPTNDVIAFRRTKQHLANHSRVTEVVIDHFNNPERYETDFWVMMYGRHNRFDHSFLLGKQNAGVTFAVRLDSEASQENHHRIDHNYFGHRPILGSNGGETLRIGTSKYSLTESNTLVERNYFERCNGEVEIISNKSGGNVFRNNVFFESRGTLTLRHGNGNIIESNVFLGNGAPHTGGIRIINARQTVRNNYLEGLTGRRFGGALVVMNGVPNSPINRYHQVEDVLIENNTIIDSDHIELAAGSDEERSAVPIRTTFRKNLIVNSQPKNSIAVHDDINGIEFEDNLYDRVAEIPIAKGFQETSIHLTRAKNGLNYPKGQGFDGAGVSIDLDVVKREQTGPEWYPKPSQSATFGNGRVSRVEPGEDTLIRAVEESRTGDTLELAGGDYLVSEALVLAHALSIKAAPDTRPRLLFEGSTLFELADGGSLELVGMTIDGSRAANAQGNSVVRTSRNSMLNNYVLRLVDSHVLSLNTNHSFNFLRIAKHTFARRIELLASTVSEVTGHVIALDQETDDLGIYNGETIVIRDSEFHEIGGAVVNIYRGGSDESTFGPQVFLRGNLLSRIGHSERNETGASVFLHGAQIVALEDNEFSESQRVRVVNTAGEPVIRIAENRQVDTSSPNSTTSSPTKTTLESISFATGHPRLLLAAEDVRTLRNAWSDSVLFSKAIERTKARIDPLLTNPPAVPLPLDPGGGYTHERHKANGIVIADAGALYQWTSNPAYAALVRDLMLAYAEMYQELGPHPVTTSSYRGRLFWQMLNESVWLVHAIQGYDAVFDQFSSEDRERIETGVLRPMASFLSFESPQMFDRVHNHGTWAAAAVGMTGYVLEDADYVNAALAGTGGDGEGGFLAQLSELFSPDGYYLEGPYYLRYAIMPFVLFARAIERNEPERRIFEYRDGIIAKAIHTVIQLSYAGRFFPVNDALPEKGLDTMELDNAIAIAYAITADTAFLSLVNEDSHLVLNADGLRLALAKEAGIETPFPFASKHFRDGPQGQRGALTVLRSGTTSKDMALVFKASSHGLGHGHFDRLNWLLYDNGVEVVADYGAARFLNVPQKAGGHYLPENASWAKTTLAHNTPVIDRASQFDGNRAPADASFPTRHVFQSAEGVQTVSAEENLAYPGTRLRRTMLLVEREEFDHPVVIDVLRVTSDRPRLIDVPLYFKGQLIDSSPNIIANQTLRPLGESNGYQHLWPLGETDTTRDGFSFTWLQHGRFYTYKARANVDMTALYTRLGASDPDFSLRSEQGLLFRTQPVQDFTLVAVLEPHGEYSGAREYTIGSESRIASIHRVERAARELVVIDTKEGSRFALALSYQPDAESTSQN